MLFVKKARLDDDIVGLVPGAPLTSKAQRPTHTVLKKAKILKVRQLVGVFLLLFSDRTVRGAFVCTAIRFRFWLHACVGVAVWVCPHLVKSIGCFVAFYLGLPEEQYAELLGPFTKSPYAALINDKLSECRHPVRAACVLHRVDVNCTFQWLGQEVLVGEGDLQDLLVAEHAKRPLIGA